MKITPEQIAEIFPKEMIESAIKILEDEEDEKEIHTKHRR